MLLEQARQAADAGGEHDPVRAWSTAGSPASAHASFAAATREVDRAVGALDLLRRQSMASGSNPCDLAADPHRQLGGVEAFDRA